VALVNGRLEGRVAVVTGGASGMGKATVLRFLDEGASVVVGDLNAESGKGLAAEVEKAGHGERFRFLVTDVSEEADVEALVAAASDGFGTLDVMFNNAGVGGAFGPITDIEADHWDQTFAILVRSVFLGTKHAARVMIPQGGGCIINTASIAGLAGGGGPQAYSAAKAAVINLSMSTAAELAVHHIRVNAICPGIIFTPLATGGDPSHMEATVEALQPWPEKGRGEDIAGAALWLASDDAAFVTGEALRVDGGLTAIGTRALGGIDPHGAFSRYTGMTQGTTGRPAEKRRL
jgi:NAD(P)-dependent dehydrogenase (short-subunit alcohol dehydrogenase family)